MARPAKPRPFGEHLATLTRLLRQVDADDRIAGKRRQRIKEGLGGLLTEFQALIMAPADGVRYRSQQQRPGEAATACAPRRGKK